MLSCIMLHLNGEGSFPVLGKGGRKQQRRSLWDFIHLHIGRLISGRYQQVPKGQSEYIQGFQIGVGISKNLDKVFEVKDSTSVYRELCREVFRSGPKFLCCPYVLFTGQAIVSAGCLLFNQVLSQIAFRQGHKL